MTRTQWTEEGAAGLWDYIQQRPNAVQTEMRAFLHNTYGIKVASSPMSRFLKTNKATYLQIMAQAVERGDRSVKRSRTRRKSLLITNEMAEGLWEYIRQRPTATSTDMRLFLKNLYGVTVSKGTMCNFLRNRQLYTKNFSQRQLRNSEIKRRQMMTACAARSKDARYDRSVVRAYKITREPIQKLPHFHVVMTVATPLSL